MIQRIQMAKVFPNLQIGLDENLKEKLEWMVPDYGFHRILRQSLDARPPKAPHWIYAVEVFSRDEEPPPDELVLEKISAKLTDKPIVIGAGPAGLFAALRLTERGIPCILLERGSVAEKRIHAINRYWRYGELDAENNVCFGEGGAGLYSDGKLITRIKSPHIPYVMDRLVRFGAPAEIKYLANPHVGSDRIRRVIPKMREFLLANGCEIHFDTTFQKLIFETSTSGPAQITGVQTTRGDIFNSQHIILATGHSAEDVFHSLHQQNVFMEGKSFAVGLRMEHPQAVINKIQYRDYSEHPALGSANYRLAHHDAKTGIGVYSFCMCPGGYVLSSGTDAKGIVCNGMSNYKRNSPFANAAIVVSVDHEKRFGAANTFAGVDFRNALEHRAFNEVQKAGGSRQIPVQSALAFMKGEKSEVLPSSTPSGVAPVRLDLLLPNDITEKLREGLLQFNTGLRGFLSPQAQLHGMESRTSCPLRVTRDPDSLQSVSHLGLYPAGEGAGYAGGITSAACDGIKIAEVIAARVNSQALAAQS